MHPDNNLVGTGTVIPILQMTELRFGGPTYYCHGSRPSPEEPVEPGLSWGLTPSTPDGNPSHSWVLNIQHLLGCPGLWHELIWAEDFSPLFEGAPCPRGRAVCTLPTSQQPVTGPVRSFPAWGDSRAAITIHNGVQHAHSHAVQACTSARAKSGTSGSRLPHFKCTRAYQILSERLHQLRPQRHAKVGSSPKLGRCARCYKTFNLSI